MDYPSNSRRANDANEDDARKARLHAVNDKPEDAPKDKKIERVVSGEVARRKRPLGKRFKEVFVGGDAQSAMSYVTMDVLIPAAKDAVADAMSQGIEKLLFGEARSRSRRPNGNQTGATGRISYNSMSSRRTPPWDRDRDRPDPRSRHTRSSQNFDEIILERRSDAEEIIDRLFDLISKYDVASVADLYDLAGITGGNHTDNKWGWSDIRGAGVTRVRGGYLLDLPRPEPID